MQEPYLGEFEELVLLAILGLPDGESYAVPVQQHIATRAERTTTLGNVYRTLGRLEKKGFVRSWMGEVTRAKGGKRKRMYEVTGAGQAALINTRDARTRMWDGVTLKPVLRLRGV